MTQRKPRKRKQPNRARSYAVQIYLSGDEITLLRMLASKKRVSVAELVRGWVIAGAAARGMIATDPRQLPPLA